MSEQRHRVRNGILLGMTLRPSASAAHIPPLSTTVRAFRISNNKTRSTIGPLIAPEHSPKTNLNRYKILLHFVRFNNIHTTSQQQEKDKLAAICDMLEQVNKNSKKYFMFRKYIIADEELIPY
ncbi:hypothetical protein HZH68_002908 [Vespula germanica]|uniref:Uncharacterized protein n=1 Tax=Vespula germanica TaxID=30212 RepID=A0A834U248_VESGE|nr:hypothetical protein HZH68_002908 [Vespula germanica]